MPHHLLESLLRHHDGVVSAWLMLAAGMTLAAIRHHTGNMRRVHHGVWVSGHAPLTPQQRWWAAVLTAPNTVLAADSAAAAHEMFDSWRPGETVLRPGDGGPKQFGSVTVYRSRRLGPDVGYLGHLPITSPPRTVLDLVTSSDDVRADRVVRDALRSGKVDDASLLMIVGRHAGARGVARLRGLAHRYNGLPATRAKSDAELLALAILRAAGVPLPALNVKRAGREADLSWPEHRLIIELDGGSTHMFPIRDAEIQAHWERAGWTVRRLPTDDVYARPDRLLALAPPPAR